MGAGWRPTVVAEALAPQSWTGRGTLHRSRCPQHRVAISEVGHDRACTVLRQAPGALAQRSRLEIRGSLGVIPIPG